MNFFLNGTLVFSNQEVECFPLFFQISMNGKVVLLALYVVSAFVGKRNDFSFCE